MEYAVSDPTGNGDGRLDAGETVDVTVTLRNYGESATSVFATLTTDDPFIVLTQGEANYGDMATGDMAVNTASPFVITASVDAPSGHLAAFVLSATDADGEMISTFDIPIGKFHYLVWDPTPDTSSGPTIGSLLAGMGFSGAYVQRLPVDRLDQYQSVWVSLGIYSNNFVIGADSPEALAIVDYLDGGGCVYMEGGDTWYYDPLIGGHSFGTTFGLSAVEDGTSDCGPVRGRDGTFAKGMNFRYVGENEWIDHLTTAAPGALLVLENELPVYGLGVSYDSGTYRTFGASYELAGLENAADPSTQAYLALSIMEFFIPSITDVDDGLEALKGIRLAAQPNPFNPTTCVSFVNPAAGRVRLSICDVSGRLVRVLADGERPAGVVSIEWDGRDSSGRALASGIYFARLEGQTGERDFSGTGKLVLLK